MNTYRWSWTNPRDGAVVLVESRGNTCDEAKNAVLWFLMNGDYAYVELKELA